ncbi:hypothetical protein JAO76_13645 [Pontibacter sp. BT310]|uniref:Uncharacterized protein n=1 Tax=Pontibacter populi TaxID=890055 RepID=A0ABS6XDN5_9BACT|nr:MULTISPECIES: hypothetical protein [Pontibacter]MBJ6119248.1 hypothetical protein [Pontibacter sp. BT310]MBR0571676.1 hypothetical protein [Microvirga sp. STS03]MBW3366102.1 hypothetical protein [Pontibacter populi]
MKIFLEIIKDEDPEIEDFISSIEPYLTDKGFNSTDFENELNSRLAAIREEVKSKLQGTDGSKD